MIDRRLAHTTDIFFAVLAVVLGALFLFKQDASSSLAEIESWLPPILACGLLVGGSLILAGILPNWKASSTRWTLEEAGGIAVSGSWAGFAWTLASAHAGSVVASVLVWFFALAAITRVGVLWFHEQRTRKATGTEGRRT